MGAHSFIKRRKQKGKYRRRVEKGKIAVNMSEKVIRNHNINTLPQSTYITSKLIYKYSCIV